MCVQTLDSKLRDPERIKAIAAMLLQQSKGDDAVQPDDVAVAAAQQLAEEYIASQADSEHPRMADDIVVLAALALSAIDAGKGESTEGKSTNHSA